MRTKQKQEITNESLEKVMNDLLLFIREYLEENGCTIDQYHFDFTPSFVETYISGDLEHIQNIAKKVQ